MKKNILLGCVLSIGLMLSGCGSSSNPGNPQNSSQTGQSLTQTGSSAVSGTQTTTVSTGYTLSDIASHSTSSDCWLAINGKVYDVTKFIPNHPGGPGIVQGCGKDATQLFQSKSAHNGKEDMLGQYFIGNLKN